MTAGTDDGHKKGASTNSCGGNCDHACTRCTISARLSLSGVDAGSNAFSATWALSRAEARAGAPSPSPRTAESVEAGTDSASVRSFLTICRARTRSVLRSPPPARRGSARTGRVGVVHRRPPAARAISFGRAEGPQRRGEGGGEGPAGEEARGREREAPEKAPRERGERKREGEES
eukprot:scaffold36637_cov30-Tisochrysis_lutea.AAC.4